MELAAGFPARPTTGLHGWIRSNDSRSLQFFAGFAIAVQLLAAIVLFLPLSLLDEAHSPLFGPVGYLLRYVPLILVGSVILFALQLGWHMETVKQRAGFRYVDAQDEPRLCAILEPLIRRCGIQPPFVAVIESASANAFACGISRRHAVVVVTRGLLTSLDDAQLEAVLAHELTHIRNGDIRLMAAANICMTNMETLDRLNLLQVRHWSQAIWCLALPFLFPLMIVGGLISQIAMRTARQARFAITSSREYIADAEAAQITKNPAALAAALVRIRRSGRVAGLAPKDDAMMISGAEHGDGATHPPIQHRLDALARVTGPMMFNAPGAAPLAALGGVEHQAAFGRRRPVVAETGDCDDSDPATRPDLIGLTRQSRWALAGAFVLFVALSLPDLGDGRAMAAKFDIRNVGLLLTAAPRCKPEIVDEACRAEAARREEAVRAQRGTLVGLLAVGGGTNDGFGVAPLTPVGTPQK